MVLPILLSSLFSGRCTLIAVYVIKEAPGEVDDFAFWCHQRVPVVYSEKGHRVAKCASLEVFYFESCAAPEMIVHGARLDVFGPSIVCDHGAY